MICDRRFRPEHALVAEIDELSGDANGICGSPNRSPQQEIEAELALQRFKLLGRKNSAWNARANGHAEFFSIDARECRDHILGQANGEVVLRVASKIFNRQDSNADSIAPFRWL